MLWGGAQVHQTRRGGECSDARSTVVPVLLGDGARLFDNLGAAGVRLEQVRAVEAPGVTHLKYTVAVMTAGGRRACRVVARPRRR